MFCENCGAKLADNAKFCTECGTKVTPVAIEEKTVSVVEEVAKVEEPKLEIEDKNVPVVGNTAEKTTEAKTNTDTNTTEAVNGALVAGGAAAGAVVTAATAKAEVAEVKAEATANEEILRIGGNMGKKPENASPAHISSKTSSDSQGKRSESQPKQQDKGIFQEYFEEIQKFNCAGRLNRLKYWKFVGVNFIFVFVVTTLLNKLGISDKVLSFFSLIMSILFVPFSVRRLHDLNKNGLFLLLAFIPGINFLFGIYMGFFKGTEGPNQYGEDPLKGNW